MENKRFNPNPSPRQRRYHHIPPCGGLHSYYDEQHCYHCQGIQFRKDTLTEMRRANTLKELELELGPKPVREKAYISPPPTEPRPKIERRGA